MLPATEVAQQSKAPRKDDFLIAFSPIIAEATATAYKGATNEVQQKLRRVVEVWRQRQIFEIPIQEAIETRIDGEYQLSVLIYVLTFPKTWTRTDPQRNAQGARYSPPTVPPLRMSLLLSSSHNRLSAN